MTAYRHLYTSFWKDIYIKNLKEDEKLLYIYLLTNTDTSQCGIYLLDLDLANITFKNFNTVFQKFITDNKIKFNKNTNEIAIKNWSNWNTSKSPKVIKHIHTEFKELSDKTLINYSYTDEQLYNMDMIMNSYYERENKDISFIFSNFYTDKKYRNEIVSEIKYDENPIKQKTARKLFR